MEWPTVRYSPMPGLAEVEVQGCVEECEHVWDSYSRVYGANKPSSKSTLEDHGPDGRSPYLDAQEGREIMQAYCLRCHGWRGSLGLEPTPKMYIAHLVLVFRELKRVLRDDGTVFCNIGDSYASQGGPEPAQTKWQVNGASKTQNAGRSRRPTGTLKPKDLIGIPWRLAFALQADGWWNRSEIIWAKGVSFCKTYAGSCMPGSQKDRPTKSHEQVFLFTKSKHYFYDHIAVKEEASSTGGITWEERKAAGEGPRRGFSRNRPAAAGGTMATNGSGRNLRSVWLHSDPAAEFRAYCASQGVDLDALAQGFVDGQRELKSVWVINPKGSKLKHFASFPPALVEPCIKAGSSERGCCPECGAPWQRVVEKRLSDAPTSYKGSTFTNGKTATHQQNRAGQGERTETAVTVGWVPTCGCNMAYPGMHLSPDDPAFMPYDPIPCTILDPFVGTGVTLKVAIQLGRRGIGIDLSQNYVEMAAGELDAPLQVSLF